MRFYCLDDMDIESSPLIGAHGYCSQEMVNLLLTGQAVSNTFDGQIVLEDSGSISRPGSFGFLGRFFPSQGHRCTGIYLR